MSLVWSLKQLLVDLYNVQDGLEDSSGMKSLLSCTNSYHIVPHCYIYSSFWQWFLYSYTNVSNQARVLYYIIFKSHNYMLYTSTLEIVLCKFAFSNCAKKFQSRVNLASQFRTCVNLAAQKKGLQFLICSVQFRNYVNLQITRNVYLHMTVHVTSCFVWVEHSRIFYLAILRIHKWTPSYIV